MVRLEGDDLLAFMADNQHLSERDMMIQAGYVKPKQGTTGVQRSEFFRAAAKAKGLDMPKSDGHKRKPTGRIKITSKGTLPLGAPYTRALGLEMGDYIQANVEEGRIILTPWGETEKSQDIEEEVFSEQPVCPMPARVA